MTHVNVEIKARCDELDRIRNILKELRADFKGTDHQIDTYFRVPSGRSKVREGDIENYLDLL
jgi:adenylate cyclase class 2